MTSRWPQLTPEQDRDAYLQGIRRWNEGRFFEAHEVWENAWRAAAGDKRSFYQGLIQFAVGLLKLQRGQPEATLKLCELAREKWARLPAVFLGLDCSEFRSKLDIVLAPPQMGDPNRQAKPNCDRLDFPKIALSADVPDGVRPE